MSNAMHRLRKRSLIRQILLIQLLLRTAYSVTTTGTTQSTTPGTTQTTTTGTTQSTTAGTTQTTTTGTTQSTTHGTTQSTTTGTTPTTTTETTQTTTTTKPTTTATTQTTRLTTSQKTTQYTGSIRPTTQYTGSIRPTTQYTGSIRPTTQYTGSIRPTTQYTGSIRPTTQYTGSIRPTTTAMKKITTYSVPVFDSLSPNRGPVAGGTKVIFRGQRLNETITAIYFGSRVQRTIISSTYDSLAVYSPLAPWNGSVTIALIFNDTLQRYITTNLTFEYQPNPSIDQFLAAPVQLTSGGSLLFVVGSSFDSVVNPQVNVTVVLMQPASCNRCRRATNLMQPYAINSYLGNCTYESSENMTCILPDLHLRENFTSKLQEDRQNHRNFSTTEPGSVAKLYGPDGSEAYVYIGFIFDGYVKYENVSDPKSGLQEQLHLNFVPPPVINSSKELIIFSPQKEDEIQIKGEFLLDGCNYGVLCEVLVGNAQCRITQVTDNVMTCVPPKEKPNQSPNDLFCRPTYPNSLKIEIHIGFKSYYYKCLDYYFLNLELIVGLTVGLGILALIAICVALFFCIRKLRSRKKPPPSGGPLQRLQEVDRRDSPFIRPSSPQSNLTTSPQNTKRNNFENLRMNILRNYNANGYSTEIRNENYLQSQDDGEPQTDDVERQTDDVAAFPQNYYRRTIYPPDYIQRRDNEYTSTINNDSAECGAYDNHSGPGDGIGGLQSPPRQSYIPPSFGNSWENYDYNLSENGDESEDKDTYANFGEIGCN